MSVAGLKRSTPVGWQGSVRELVDRFAERHVFEATESQRAEIARRAEAFVSAASTDAAAHGWKSDLADADWKARATAASRLAEAGAWMPWSVAGSLGSSMAAAPGHDDTRLASAIFVAARETLAVGLAERHERLRGSAGAALAHERDGAAHWDAAARPLISEFARNARAHGADRTSSALRALAAAVHVKGRALQAASTEDPFLIGSAAASLLRERSEASEDGAPSALEELTQVIATLNDARTELWDDADMETSRRMGAAAAFAAFGRGTVSAPLPLAAGNPVAFMHPPADVLDRYAILTASETAAALDDESADPRLDARRSRRLATLADALRRHPAAYAVSCAEALGAEASEARVAGLKPGMKVYRTVAGRRRVFTCAGKNGRTVRCRAIAADGAHVGYLAYDALSREFGGRPLYAVYGPEGGRYGYAWADGRPIVRRGEPEQGFVTAPECIPV